MSLYTDIPNSVIKEAKYMIDIYGANLEYLGKYKRAEIYEFRFPENTETGYPLLYVFDSQCNVVTKVTGFDALEIIEHIE